MPCTASDENNKVSCWNQWGIFEAGRNRELGDVIEGEDGVLPAALAAQDNK